MTVSNNFLTFSTLAVTSMTNACILGREKQSNEAFITLMAINALAGVAVAYLQDAKWVKTTKKALGAAAGIVALFAITFFTAKNSQALAGANLLIAKVVRGALSTLSILKPSQQDLSFMYNDAASRLKGAESVTEHQRTLMNQYLGYLQGDPLTGSFADNIAVRTVYLGFKTIQLIGNTWSSSIR